MTIYAALLRKDPNSAYSVDFPDFPGCVTAGRSLEEAKRLAHEAIEFHIAGMIEDHESVPPPTALDAILADPHTQDAVVMLVDVRAEPIRSVRINVTLPEDLIHRIDRSTNNRSRFLADAARARLNEIA